MFTFTVIVGLKILVDLDDMLFTLVIYISYNMAIGICLMYMPTPSGLGIYISQIPLTHVNNLYTYISYEML